MRLFHALMRRKHMPNGHIYRGKDRIVKEVTREDVQLLKNDFAIEERNMLYLRNPYLTPEQSYGHAKAMGIPEKRLLSVLTKKKEFYENVTIESRLAHLRYNEPWD